MTRDRLAALCARVGAGLLFATAGYHLQAYRAVVNQTPAELQPIVAALWVAGGLSLALAALLVIAVSPLFIVRRRAILLIASLTPLSIAALQLYYLGFIPPTALLLLDAGVVIASGELGKERQPGPRDQAFAASRHSGQAGAQ